MRSLFIQFSALIGILTLANRMAGETTAVDAGLAALGAAAAMYIVLAAGDWTVRRVMDFATPPTASPAATPQSSPAGHETTPTPTAERTSALAA